MLTRLMAVSWIPLYLARTALTLRTSRITRPPTCRRHRREKASISGCFGISRAPLNCVSTPEAPTVLQWLNVGFGALQANNLRWGGAFDANTGTLTVLTDIGIAEGLTAGSAFPAPTNALSGLYFICQTGGNSITQPDLSGVTFTPGDWALCINETQGWMQINAGATGGGGGGGATYLNDLLDVERTERQLTTCLFTKDPPVFGKTAM